jgi:steroid delta-isomerase-like uncharacterized protein
VGNSDTLRRMFELVRARDVDGFADRLSDDFVEREVGPGTEPTKDGTKQLFRMLTASFPDLRFDAEDIIESDDKVVARPRITGTNKGDLMGMPASDKSIDIQAIDIVRFGGDGLAHERWGVMDVMATLQQIGAIPTGPPPVYGYVGKATAGRSGDANGRKLQVVNSTEVEANPHSAGPTGPSNLQRRRINAGPRCACGVGDARRREARRLSCRARAPKPILGTSLSGGGTYIICPAIRGL